MSPGEAGGVFDARSVLLAACDDALAAGLSTTPQNASGTDIHDPDRLVEDVAWCRLVRRLLGVVDKGSSFGSSFPSLAASLPRLLDTAERPAGLPAAIGRFQIRRELGRGGCGVVFLAYDPKLGREIALKVPRPEVVLYPELRSRFAQEARAAAGLDHPNIVPVYEAGDEGSICYIASAYCPGTTLSEWLKTRTAPVSGDVAASLIAALADAVEHAHRRGILHRDLKPGNVMLSPVAMGETANSPVGLPSGLDVVPRVMDFGLAKLLAGESGMTGANYQTQNGAVVGTPTYMAPEQADGQNDRIGPATDVYALGTILYEVLTGRPPFRADSIVNTLVQVRTQEPISPARFRSDIPRDLVTICLKCLQKAPERRYSSALELADDLRRFLSRLPILARRVGVFHRVGLWIRRNRSLAATAAVAFLAIVAVSAVGILQVLRERDRYRQERDLAQANLYRALVGETRSLMKARDTGWWWQAMDNLRDAGKMDVACRDRDELRSLAIECMGSPDPCFRLEGTWSGHGGAVTGVAFQPDGRIAASGSRDSTVRLWSVPDGQPLGVFTGHANAVTSVAFDPNGRHLASGSADGTVCIWDINEPTRPPVRTLRLQADSVTQVLYSPDGTWLVAGCNDGAIRLFPTAADHPEKAVQGHSGAITCLMFTPGGRLVSGGVDRTIRFWDVIAAKPTDAWTTLEIPSSLAYLPIAGGYVAWSDMASAGLSARCVATGELLFQNHLHSGGVTGVRSNKWQQWMTASTDGTMKLWSQVGNRVNEAAVARGEFGPVRAIDVAPSGKEVVAGYDDGRIRYWRMEMPPQRAWVGYRNHNMVFADGRYLVDGSSITDLTSSFPGPVRRYTPSPARALAVNPAGGTFAVGRGDGTLERWSWPDRREQAKWMGHSAAVNSLTAGPDGRFASASDDGTVKLWRWDATDPEKILEPAVGAVHAIVWGSEGRFLAACGERGVVLWDLRTNTPPQQLSDRALPAGAVALGMDIVAYSDLDGTIGIRDLTSGKVRRLRGHTAPVTALAFSPDGTRLASGAPDGTVRVWDTATGADVERIEGMLRGRSLMFDKAGRYLLCATHPWVILFDLNSHQPIAHMIGVNGLAEAACFSPGETDLLFAANLGGVIACPMAEIARLRAEAGNPTAAVRVDVSTPFVTGGHAHGVWGISASPDGRWVATAGHDHVVKLWDARTMNLVRTLEGHSEVVWSVAFSPDSRLLASGSSNQTAGDLRIWEVETGQMVRKIDAHTKLISALAFHPRRPWLISGSHDGSLLVWDIERCERLGSLHRFDRAVHDIAFRPDGRRLAVATGDPQLAVWNVSETPPNGPPEWFLAGHLTAIRSVAFSPDCRTLASGSDQGMVILWNGETRDRLVTLRSGTGQIRGLSFSSDGELLAAAGYTTQTIVWDLSAVRRTLREMNLDW